MITKLKIIHKKLEKSRIRSIILALAQDIISCYRKAGFFTRNWIRKS